MATMTLTDMTFSNYAAKTALEITTAGTYTFDNCIWDQSGSYDIETSHSSGLVTIVLSNGSTGLVNGDVNNTGGGTFVIENNVTLEVTGVATGSEPTNYVRCFIALVSDDTVLMNEEADASAGGGLYKATEDYNYEGDVAVYVRARYQGFLPFETTGTVTSAGLSVTAVWQLDPNYNL